VSGTILPADRLRAVRTPRIAPYSGAHCLTTGLERLTKCPAVTSTAAWAPACAGVTVVVVIPAKAGIQNSGILLEALRNPSEHRFTAGGKFDRGQG
jgi:hypothetical protein